MLKVSRKPDGRPEIFASIQGEGVSMGRPSVFLRLALCNLRCSWCDTKYTWDWQRYDYASEVMELSVDEVEREVELLAPKNLVITGGEPTMQQKALIPLLQALRPKGYCTEIETNGTIAPMAEMLLLIGQWNVSPKLNNSGNSAAKREIAPALEAFRDLDTAYFKFVVAGPEDIPEVQELISKYRIPCHRVLLMPEATTKAKLNEMNQWLTQVCIEEGFRFSTRLHILLWGDKRGA